MGKHYACSDLHGIYNLWEQIRDYLQPDDTLYFLGDACDRGPDGLKIMQELLEDKRVKYIRGNHEQMLINALQDRNDLQLWLSNGAGATYKDIYTNLSWEEREMLIYKLKTQTLVYAVYEPSNIILTHSGFELDELDPEFLWDRKHIPNKWTKAPEYKDVILVHGHTIVWTLDHYDPELNPLRQATMIRYCDGHKIDIDMGSAFTGKACLLDLDTLKPIYFEVEGFNKNEYYKYVGKGIEKMKMPPFYVIAGAIDGQLVEDFTYSYPDLIAAMSALNDYIDDHCGKGWCIDFNSETLVTLVTDENNELRGYYKIFKMQPVLKEASYEIIKSD